MPFVTEEIYQSLGYEACCIAKWPEKVEGVDKTALDEVERLISIIKTVREIKVNYSMKPSAPINLMIKDLNKENVQCSEIIAATLARMAKATLCDTLEGELLERPVYQGSILVPMGEIVNKEEEIAKLNKEKERLAKEIKRGEGMLSNQNFVAKAPAAKIEEETRKLENYKAQMQIVLERLEEFSK